MERRGILFSEDEKRQALSLLKQHGYYQIVNGYGNSFEHSENGKEKSYSQDVKFSDIYEQFYFDRKLGNLLFNYLLDIQENFTNVLGYEIAKYFDVNNYYTSDTDNRFEDITSYLDKKRYPNKPTKILKELHDLSISCNDYPTKWYRKNKNHVPPWILFMNTELGTLNRYFSLLPTKIKIDVGNEILPSKLKYHSFQKYFVNNDQKAKNAYGSFIFSGLELMREFRNCIAHNRRFYNYHCFHNLPSSIRNLSQTSILYNNKEFFDGIGKEDLFALLIWIITCQPSKKINFEFLNDFDYFINSSKENNNNFFIGTGLPENYFKRLQIYINNIH